MYRDNVNENKVIQYIADQSFSFLKDMTVVELGSCDGTFFTQHIHEVAKKVLCIENDTNHVNSLLELTTLKNNIEVLHGDFHDHVRTVGQFDAAVIFGVLYHSPAPLMVLEDMVNFVQPKIILLEGLHSKDEIWCNFEEPNELNMRITDQKSCKLVLNTGFPILQRALNNLGYNCIKTFTVNDFDTDFKSGATYGVFVAD